MAKLKKFAVEHNVAVHLVAHQNTPMVQKDEDYPKPNLYKIKGGGTFADKADNVVIVWRPHRNTDQRNTLVKFISQKIKKQKLTGIPGEADIFYNFKQNRYDQHNGNPFDWYKPEQQELYDEKETSWEDIHSSFMKETEVPF